MFILPNCLAAQSTIVLNGIELEMPPGFLCNNISEKYANEIYQRNNSVTKSNFLILNSNSNVSLPHELITDGYMLVSETPNKNKIDIGLLANLTPKQLERFTNIMDSTMLLKNNTEYLTLDNVVQIKNPYTQEISNSEVSFVNDDLLIYSVELIGIKKQNMPNDFPNIVQSRSFVYLSEIKAIGISYVCVTSNLGKFKMLKSSIESSCRLKN
jgi:hypothetical protein